MYLEFNQISIDFFLFTQIAFHRFDISVYPLCDSGMVYNILFIPAAF